MRVKNSPVNTGDVRDAGSVPGLRRSPGGGHATDFGILAWRRPGSEELGGLQATGCKESDTSEVTQHVHTEYR